MQLHRMEDKIEEAGGHLVIIGNGLASFMQAFREKSGFQGALYTDPGRRIYKALELRRGIRSSVNLHSVRRALSAYRDGYRQTRVQGDAMQQGGVFVVGTDGQSTLEYRSRYAGDHPRDESVLAAVARAHASGNAEQGESV